MDLETTVEITEEQDNQPQTPKRKGVVNVLEWVEEIVFAVIAIAILFTFVVRVITVRGPSMMETYHDGDRVLVTNLTNVVGQEYKQGDVVIIVNALDEPIIKRIIATEGQTVDFDPDVREVTVDGEIVDETRFGVETGITEVPEYPGQVLSFPQTVPEGCVFVMGDNRYHSTDSRFTMVGMVDSRNLLGKVVFNLFPLDNFGFVSIEEE